MASAAHGVHCPFRGFIQQRLGLLGRTWSRSLVMVLVLVMVMVMVMAGSEGAPSLPGPGHVLVQSLFQRAGSASAIKDTRGRRATRRRWAIGVSIRSRTSHITCTGSARATPLVTLSRPAYQFELTLLPQPLLHWQASRSKGRIDMHLILSRSPRLAELPDRSGCNTTPATMACRDSFLQHPGARHACGIADATAKLMLSPE